MEDHYNCYLLPTVDAHHKNGIKDDNRLENLEVLPHWEHASISAKKDTSGWTCSECGRNKTTFRKPNSRYPQGRHEWRYRKGHKFDGWKEKFEAGGYIERILGAKQFKILKDIQDKLGSSQR